METGGSVNAGKNLYGRLREEKSRRARAATEPVLKYVDPKGILHEREFSQGYVRTTNNRMELMAAIVGLEALKKPCEVELYSDSQYLIKAFNEHWIDGWIKKGWTRGKKEPVKNVDLWKRLLAAKEPHQVTFIWVKGHAGHPENERCDALATRRRTATTGSWIRGYKNCGGLVEKTLAICYISRYCE